MKKKLVLFICFICIVGVGIYIFNHFNGQLLSVKVFNDYMIADNLEVANENAEYVIKGQFTSYDRNWNMHRDDSDLLQEHPYEKITGKIYSFKVTDILKGDADETSISVNLKYSTRLFFNDSGLLHGQEILDSENVEYIDYKESVYVEPELNKDYILYLNYDKNFSLYYAAFQPYIIKVDQNQLSVQSNLINSDTVALKTYQTKSRKIEIQEDFEKVDDFVKNISLEEFVNKFNNN